MQIHRVLDRLPSLQNVVLTIGTFDGVHQGHKTILKKLVSKAREINGESVLITFEPHPRFLVNNDKPIYLLTTLEEKVELLNKLGIDHLVILNFDDAFSRQSAQEYFEQFLWKNFSPSCIIIGYDHRFGHNREGGLELLESYAHTHHFELIEIPKQVIEESTISSSLIRKALQIGNVKVACRLLGQYYSLKALVIRGDQRGRTLGFPTANLQPVDKHKIIPETGVYAVWVLWNGRKWKGMLNIGFRPSIEDSEGLHLEVCILDFNQEIYDQTLEIHFIERIRSEVKFENMEQLREQLRQDETRVRTILSDVNDNF